MRKKFRSGVTVVESAVVLPVLLLVLFGMLDLAVATVRYGALAEASRHVAREAILHGAMAGSAHASWGPDAFDGTMASSEAWIKNALGPTPTMNRDDVALEITWPDGDNSPFDRVTVELRYTHNSILPALLPWGNFEVKSATTMPIVN